MSFSLQKTGLPCMFCGSSNAVTWYEEDDHMFCYACGKRSIDGQFVDVYDYLDQAEGVWQEVRKQREDKAMDVASNSVKNVDEEKKRFLDFIYSCSREFRDLGYRKISKETCLKYGVKALLAPLPSGKKALVGYSFPISTPEGTTTKIKLNKESRFIPSDIKTRYHIEKPDIWNNKSGLFGQNLFAKGNKYVTIVEGEIDALATYQMLKGSSNFEPAVVSVKNGAGSVKSFFKKNPGAFAWLNSFDIIRVVMDNDKEGRKAVEHFKSIFGKSKLSIVYLPEGFKDPGEMLEKGEVQKFINCWRNGEEFQASNILMGDASIKLLEEDDANPISSYNLVFDGLNKKTFGGRNGEVWVWTAQAKIGKNTVLREVTYDLIKRYEDVRLGTIYLEGKTANHIKDYIGLVANKPFRRPDCEYTKKEYEEAKKSFPSHKIGFFDTREEYDYGDIIDAMNYYVDVQKCNVIIFDNAMVLSEQSSEKEREILNKFMSFACRLADSRNVWINIVAHLNREDNIQGTSNIEKKADMVVRLTRDTMNEDEKERNTTRVYVTHNRFTGDTGFACKLLFNPETGRLEEYWDEPKEAGECDDEPISDKSASGQAIMAEREDKVRDEIQRLTEQRGEHERRYGEGREY